VLLEHGADPDAETADGLDTPLHLACLGGHVDTAAALLAWPDPQSGCARLRATNKDGWSPLHLAIMSGQRAENQATVQLLLRHRQLHQQHKQPLPRPHSVPSGDFLDAINFEGWNAVLLAASRGMDQILELLLQAGAR
jgi:ankyrin repeat protein